MSDPRVQLCFAIAEKFGVPELEVEEWPLDELARYAEWFSLKARAHEEALKDAKKGR